MAKVKVTNYLGANTFKVTVLATQTNFNGVSAGFSSIKVKEALCVPYTIKLTVPICKNSYNKMLF